MNWNFKNVKRYGGAAAEREIWCSGRVSILRRK